MNDANEASERDMFWLKALIADNVVFAGWIAVIAYVATSHLVGQTSGLRRQCCLQLLSVARG